MTEAIRRTPGRVVWRELMTRDVDAAKSFYGELFGWTIEDQEMGDMLYPRVMVDGQPVAGFIAMGEEEGDHPPHWMSYVSVEDVDAAATTAEKAGGKIGVPPMDIPPIGRFSVLGDGQGAWITAFKGSEADPEPVEHESRSGMFCWECLFTPDLEAAASFYASVFGWEVGEGPAGPGTLFLADGAGVADVEKVEDEAASWLPIITIDALEPTCAAVRSLGGEVVMAPTRIPGLGSYAIIADPQGAHLGLMQPGE